MLLENYGLHEWNELRCKNFAASAANWDEFVAALRRVALRHCERSEAIHNSYKFAVQLQNSIRTIRAIRS